MNGTLALVGGEEFTEACSFDAALLQGVQEVLLLPAALAYENPGEVIERAHAYFATFGVSVRVLDVYRRAEAMEPLPSELASAAQMLYLTGGSPMHQGHPLARRHYGCLASWRHHCCGWRSCLGVMHPHGGQSGWGIYHWP